MGFDVRLILGSIENDIIKNMEVAWFLTRFCQTWTICLGIEDSEKFPDLQNHSAEEFFF